MSILGKFGRDNKEGGLMQGDYTGEEWFLYLDHSMKDLVEQTMVLWERESNYDEVFHDYSFLVFPMAKAYEGFLKKFFVDLGLISEQVAHGKHFRIGKSLNPDLPTRYRKHDWLFDDVEKLCGEQIARELWEMWRKGRNMLFHYFPKHKKFLKREEAKEMIDEMAKVMSGAVVCLGVSTST